MENILEEGRGFRNRKKQTDPIYCPVCGVTIRSSEIEQHYALEIDRLMKLQLNSKLKKVLNNGITYHDPLPGCSSNGSSNGESSGCPWVTFQKIRNNRYSRLRIKTKKRKPDEPICPVCNEHPANEDINKHVEICLRKNENKNKSNNGASNTISDDDDESIDIEGESFEEYEWAGQKRIRASSLLEGGYAGVGLVSSNNSGNNNSGSNSNNNVDDDEDEDLNVDGDDSQIYGPPQYSERDVILPLNSESDSENSDIYLRRLVTGQNITTSKTSTITKISHSLTNSSGNMTSCNSDLQSSTSLSSHINNNMNTTNLESNIGDYNNKTVFKSHKLDDVNLVSNDNNGNSHIIESLKAKIREYENQINNKIKCLICMDEFRNPAVSICCWHVHCEECWLRTLGARKLCPQCNMISSPSDLRRIYM